MNRNRIVNGMSCLLLCLCLVLSVGYTATAVSEASPVRVGFFAFDGYHMQGADGLRSGYGYDILQDLSAYTALTFDFVRYDASWSESLDMLESGEIDLLTSAQQTPERMERFNFSALPIGASAAILTVKAGNTAYVLDDVASWSGMRVGLLEGTSRNEQFFAFAAERGFTYSAVYFSDTDDLLAALQRQDGIDAAVTSNLRKTEGEWILAQFDPSPFYIMVRKGNTALLQEINRALEQLYANEPDVNALLMSKYYLTTDGENIALSTEEHALIEASKQTPITVGILTSAAPVCYIDEGTGQFVGISMEILKAVSQKTGLHFAYLPIDLSGNSPIGWLKAGQFDLVAGVVKSSIFQNDPSLVLSDSLISDALVMVGRPGDDFTKDASSKTIAILAGFQVSQDYVSAQFPEHQLQTHSSIQACLSDVIDRRADATVYTRICTSYLLQDPHYENLKIIPAYSKDMTTCIAGLSAKQGMLIGIIDKGLAMIDDAQRNAIMMNYTILNPYHMSMRDTIYKYRVPLSVIAALLLAIIAVFSLMLSLKHRSARKVALAYEQTKEALANAEAVADKLRCQIMLTQQWQEASETDALTGLLNRRGGEQRIKSLLELGECGLFCLFDIDRFKSINDTYGHETGDAALEAVAQCMRTFRGSDIQMRYGGDEIVVFAIGISTEEQALACARKFLEAVGAITVAGMEGAKLSMSLGMHLCAQDEQIPFYDLCKLVDEAMYQCKKSEQRYRFV